MGGTHGSRLAGIDVADNDDVDVLLVLLAHFDGVLMMTERDW